MEPILTIDNLNSFGGNMLRQGDKSQLKYRLRDVGNKNLAISGKSCQVKMYGRNYTTIVYETTATVSTENTVSFTIDEVLPKGTFYLEFTVGDYIFPTDHREFFEITPSGKGIEANVIEIVGKDVLINAVKSQVDAELQPLVTSLESAQQAETQRATAESSRVSAEAQRKIDHANRSAELDSKADKVVIENLIENGDFSDGLNGWQHFNLDAEVVNGKVKATMIDTNASPTGTYFGKSGINLYKDHEYYIQFEIEPTKETLTGVFLNGNWAKTERLPVNELSVHSAILVSTSTKVSSSPDIRINHRPNGDYVNGDTFTLDNVMMIDLTETFGAGNEPTKEEMDEFVKITEYIDGEYVLNNQEMFGHLMHDIHEKANKKQEDWKPIPLTNGWVNDLPAYSSAEFYKDQFGVVHLRGHISGGTSYTIGYLPAGYRPAKFEFFLVLANISSGYSRTRTVALYIHSTGEIRSYLSTYDIGSGYDSVLALSQISYRAEV